MSIRSLIDSEGFPAADSAILIAAFEDTLMVLGLVDRDDPATLLVAKYIITIAKAGERDPVKLRDLALKAVREWCDDGAPAPRGMDEGTSRPEPHKGEFTYQSQHRSAIRSSDARS